MTYYTRDGVALDVKIDAPERPGVVVAFWPCTFGDATSDSYSVPVAELVGAGAIVVRYNPRSHGSSRGTYGLRGAVEDFADLLRETLSQWRDLPFVGVGHSGGGGGILRVLAESSRPHRALLVSPILDARESLRFMYLNGCIEKFVSLLDDKSDASRSMRSILENDRWLDEDYWIANRLRDRLDYALDTTLGSHVDCLGDFLEETFIRPVDSYEDLNRVGPVSTVLVPEVDQWFPVERSRDAAECAGATVEVLGEDHFFRNRWDYVWSHVPELIRSLAP